MKKKRVISLVLAVIVVLLVVGYLWGPGAAPRSQEPLVSLSDQNFSEFEKAFDEDTDVPPLVLLLSPT
jgi:hypothetical protein